MRRLSHIGSALAVACMVAGAALPATAQQTSSPAPAIDEQKLALAKQIVDIGYPPEAREAMFFGAMDQMNAQMRQAALDSLGAVDDGAKAVLDQWVAERTANSKAVLRAHIPSLMHAWAQAYASMFTQAELSDILSFVQTPSGQRFFQLSPAVIAEPHFAAANQAYMDEIMAGLPEAQADLRERLQEYFSSEGNAPPVSRS